MYEIIKRNWDKTKLILSFGFIVTLLLLVAVVYKSDQKVLKKSEIISNLDAHSEIINFKKFLLNQINSPFVNVDYKINKGDTIQKILKKYKVENSEIQTVINQYKKFGKSNQLLVGNKIDIIIEKGAAKTNSLVKFSMV